MYMIDHQYVFKRVSEHHISDLQIISLSAFGFDPGKSYYINKNSTAAFGIPYLGFIAYSSEGEPAAFYGIYSQPLIKDGRLIHAAQSGDTMTHKAHIGKGLFVHLANLTYQLAKELGVEFVFGFPNENSFPGFQRKLEWKFKEQLVEYRFRVFTFPLSKLVKKMPFLNHIYSVYQRIVLKILSKKGNCFSSSALSSKIGGVNRTQEFYKYKFKFSNFIILLKQINVWLKVDGFLFIGDIQFSNEVDYDLVLKKIKWLAFFLGTDTIIFQTSPDTNLDFAFSKKGKGKKAYFVGFRDLNTTVNPCDYKFVFGDVDTF